MPLPGPTDKKRHWQDIVYTPIVAPGTFNKPSITVNEYGLVTAIVNQAISSIYVIDIPANLTTVPSPQAGDLAVVLDDSTGSDPNEPEAIYAYDADGAHIGWRRIASTAMVNPRFDYQQSTFGFSNAPVYNFGAPIDPAAIIKEITVAITTPWTPGTMIDIEVQGGSIWMPSTSINTQVVGVYTENLNGNDLPVVGTQLRALIAGGPAVGDALVFVTYINP